VAQIADDTATVHACNTMPGEVWWLEWADDGQTVHVVTDSETADGATRTHVLGTVTRDADGLFRLGEHIDADDWQYADD